MLDKEVGIPGHHFHYPKTSQKRKSQGNFDAFEHQESPCMHLEKDLNQKTGGDWYFWVTETRLWLSLVLWVHVCCCSKLDLRLSIHF